MATSIALKSNLRPGPTRHFTSQNAYVLHSKAAHCGARYPTYSNPEGLLSHFHPRPYRVKFQPVSRGISLQPAAVEFHTIPQEEPQMPKHTKATSADAQTVLQLYDFRREAEMRKARNFIANFWP